MEKKRGSTEPLRIIFPFLLSSLISPTSCYFFFHAIVVILANDNN